ncbi:17471_t:CDS:2, partial [Dentiscutata erythropus]
VGISLLLEEEVFDCSKILDKFYVYLIASLFLDVVEVLDCGSWVEISGKRLLREFDFGKRLSTKLDIEGGLACNLNKEELLVFK